MCQNIFLETDLYAERLVLDQMREEIKEQKQDIQSKDEEIQRMLQFMAEHGLEYKKK